MPIVFYTILISLAAYTGNPVTVNITGGSGKYSNSFQHPGSLNSDLAFKDASPFDVVINEIMVRPHPPVGLPEAVYIELFNRSGFPVNLQNWTINVGARSRKLPYHILQPDGFLLITHENYAGLLDEFGDVITYQGFPVLSATGQTIVLEDGEGIVISVISYSDKWYKNSMKASGGWSLEQIDPGNPCGGAENWKASVSSQGGTPGKNNSVNDNNPDNRPPRLERATMSSGGEIVLHFSEPMHPWSEWLPGSFIASGSVHPASVLPEKPYYERVGLGFEMQMEEGIAYIIEAVGNIFDCAGNRIDPEFSSVRFTKPSQPLPGDIVINEILFNPYAGGVEFVELYNDSDKTIDMKHLIVSGVNSSGEQDPSYIAAPDGYLLFPDKYVVLTTYPDILKAHYHVPFPGVLVQMDRMPPMNNEKGTLIISNLEMVKIDKLIYNSDMHSPLLADRKGVSLERINFNRPSSDLTNWLSASQNSGYATPGYLNSQFSEISHNKKAVLTIEPKIFSPDNSGYDDVVNIGYELEKPGFNGNITIYDAKGRTVRRLVRNEILGTTGTFSWDGRNEANGQSPLGIYLIFMEIYHPDGDLRNHKDTVVLGGRFRE
ncbi:MAG: lamin tail domain-containing protein [Bacteroidales bacterium]